MKNMINIDDDIYYEITDDAVKDIMPNSYFINSDGEVYSAISKRFMHPTVANNGYKVLNFKTKHKKSKCALVHRIVMITIYGLSDNNEIDQVNHKNGNKLDTDIDNLEYISLIGNNEHAQENNLLKIGSACSWSKLNEEQVKEICQHLVDKDFITLQELANKYNVSVGTIGDIARRYTWKHISQNYDFNYNKYMHLTEEQVRFICNVFVYYKNESFNYCYYYIIFNLGLPDTKSNRQKILCIYKKDPDSYSHITSQYDY